MLRNSARASELHPGSLHKTAINDVIRNGATLHEVREFAGHAEIRTTEVSFVRKEGDAEVAARRRAREPLGAVLKLRVAERAGGERGGGIQWVDMYTTPTTGGRSPFRMEGERP